MAASKSEWEYKVTIELKMISVDKNRDVDDLQKHLNKESEGGWEVVSQLPAKNGLSFLWKRPRHGEDM